LMAWTGRRRRSDPTAAAEVRQSIALEELSFVRIGDKRPV
jgi:hypothetical protein